MAILAVFRSLIWLGMTSLPPPSSVTGVNGLSVIKVATLLGRSDFPGNVAMVQLPFWKKLCLGRLRCPVDPFRGFRV